MKLQTLSLILLAGIALVGCSQGSSGNQNAKESALPQKKILYWTCAMHPQVHMDHPGKCPICGMNLVPVTDEDANKAVEPTVTESAEAKEMQNMPGMNMGSSAKPKDVANEERDMPGMPGMKMPKATGTSQSSQQVPTIKLSSAQDSVASVTVSPAKLEFLNRILTVFGEIKYIQDRHVDFTWVYGGRIEKVLIPYSTTEVQKGQPLLEVYSEEAIADQQMYLQATRDRYLTTFYERKVASAQIEVYRQKLLRAGMTEEELDNLIKQKTVKTTFTLRAPITASVVGMLPSIGERFTTDKGLFHLSAIDEVWFSGKVYEQDISSLQLGQTAMVNVKAFPAKKFEGKLIFIDRFLDPVSRTLEIRLLVKNPEKLLLPDMAGETTIAAKGNEKVLVIPESAIIDTGKRKIVYVQTAPATYRQQEVSVGRKGQLASDQSAATQNWIEVTQGLKEGDPVVTTGAFVIDAEAQLKGVGGAAHQH